MSALFDGSTRRPIVVVVTNRTASLLWRKSSCNFARRYLIHIAPDPCLSRFDGTDERMLYFVEVFGSVLVLGRVTTAYVAALQA